MFETACSDKIEQFDDLITPNSNGDEKVQKRIIVIVILYVKFFLKAFLCDSWKFNL